MCSIWVTAKTNGLMSRKYVQRLLEEMPNEKNPDDPAYLDSLMTWPGSVRADIRLKPKAAEEAARIADDPIVDINPSAFHDDEENRNLSELSRTKRENSERFIVLRACFDAHRLCSRIRG